MANEIRRGAHVITRLRNCASGTNRSPRRGSRAKNGAAPLPESERWRTVQGPEGCGHPIAESERASRVPPTHRLEVGDLGDGAGPTRQDDREARPAEPLRSPVADGAVVGLDEHRHQGEPDAGAGDGGVVTMGAALEPGP